MLIVSWTRKGASQQGRVVGWVAEKGGARVQAVVLVGQRFEAVPIGKIELVEDTKRKENT